MGWLSRILSGGSPKPQMSDVSMRLQEALSNAAADVEREFPQCTVRVKREQRAMRRMALFKDAARELGPEHPYRTTWFLTSHIWWITGLMLQRDRKSEVKYAMREDQWAIAAGLPPVLEWIRRQQPFKDEAAADIAAAELWVIQGHPTFDRPS